MLALATVAFAQADNRGLKVVGVRTTDGQDISLYENSYALLIGVSAYKAGWPTLPSIPSEISDVEAALTARGFTVTKVLDPDHTQLELGFREFIRTYGYEPGNRLLFYYAGHGWSRRGGEQGYLVPVNAPDPNKDERGFLRKALTMTQILAWCKEMEARHALFLFDSCFSGTIFTTRALPDQPPHITPLIAKSVRQFITAGDAGEEVPAKSIFTPLFIRAIQGEADLTGDGYVTGTELGLFLRDKVMYYQTGQTPQYGKIRDPTMDRGDFVFDLPALRHDAPTTPLPRPPPPASAPAPAPVGVQWSRSSQGAYHLFVDGKALHDQAADRLVVSRAGKDNQDHLVFDKQARQYILCPGFYAGAGDQALQPGTILECPTGVLWSRTPQGAYHLFVDGKALHGQAADHLVVSRAGKDNQDHLVFDKQARQYILCPGFYAGAGDQALQPGTILKSPTGVLWSRTPQGAYHLFVDGKALHEKAAARLVVSRGGKDKRDHIVFDKDTGRRFICPSFYTSPPDGALHPAIEISGFF